LSHFCRALFRIVFFIMTHTVQSNPAAMLGETEENIRLLLSIHDSLDNLSQALGRMDTIHDKLCKKLTVLEHLVHKM